MRILLKVFIALVIVGCYRNSNVSAADPLRVATLDYPPYQYQENEEIKGFAADIVREAFQRMGLAIRINVYPFPQALENIQTGASDVIFTFYHKPEREAFAYYSKEILVEQTIAFFVHHDSPIIFDGDMAKLANHTFGMARFSYGKVFDDAVRKRIIKKTEYSDTMPQNMEKFLSRRFEILPSDRSVAYYYYNLVSSSKPDNSYPKIRELKPPIESFPAYVGFSKKNNMEELRNKFDTALGSMKKDGTYQRINADFILRHFKPETH